MLNLTILVPFLFLLLIFVDIFDLFFLVIQTITWIVYVLLVCLYTFGSFLHTKVVSKSLGTKMELSGFGDFDSSTKIIIRKLVGNQVKKINDSLGDFDRLSLHLKEVHKTEKNQKYQLFGKMEMQGKIYTSEVTDFNLFFALSKVLDKLKEEIR